MIPKNVTDWPVKPMTVAGSLISLRYHVSRCLLHLDLVNSAPKMHIVLFAGTTYITSWRLITGSVAANNTDPTFAGHLFLASISATCR